MKSRTLACIAAVAAAALSGCINARWQGGTTTHGDCQFRPSARYCITDVEFNAGMGVNAQLQQWPWSDYSQDPESFRRGVMEAMPDIFTTDPSAKRISLHCRVTANSFEETVGPFILTCGILFPMRSLRQTECQIFVVKDGIRANSGANLKSTEESWIGYPWTLLCNIAKPERDESLSETVTWEHNTYNAKKGTIKAAQYSAFAKAVLRAIEKGLPDKQHTRSSTREKLR